MRKKLIYSLLGLLVVGASMGLLINARRFRTTAEQDKQQATVNIEGRALKKDGSPIKGVARISSGIDAKDSDVVRVRVDGSFSFPVKPSRTFFVDFVGFNGEVWCEKENFEFGQLEIGEVSVLVDFPNLEVCSKISGWVGPEDDTTPPKITPGSASEQSGNYQISFAIEDPAWGNRLGQVLAYYRYGKDGKWQFAKIAQDTNNNTQFTATIPKAGNQEILYFIQAGGAGGFLFSQYPEKGPDEPAKLAATPTPTATLTANPTQITAGQSTTLTWDSTNATSCVGAAEIPGRPNEPSWMPSGNRAPAGSVSVTPKNDSGEAKYTVTCTGAAGSKEASVTVKVTSILAVGVTLTANPSAITAGQSSALSWSSTNADGCFWEVPPPNTSTAPVATSGSTTVTPNDRASYTMGCSGKGGSNRATVTVTITDTDAQGKPVPIVTLTANPKTVLAGQKTTLTWSSTNATSCTGSAPGGWAESTATFGSKAVTTPKFGFDITYGYFITCTGPGGSKTAKAEVKLLR